MLKKFLASLLIVASFAAEIPFANAAATQTSQKGQNLATFSEQLDNAAWDKTNVTVTPDIVVAPDGTMTADKVEVVASAAALFARGFTGSGSAAGNTCSYFVKKGTGATTANLFAIRNDTTTTNLVIISFNYDTGAITYTLGSTGASAKPLPNGWWRLSVASKSGISNGDQVHCYLGFIGSAETAGVFFYGWGAQLTKGPKAGAYNKVVGTTVNTSFVPAGAEQSSHKGQNLILQSQTFDSGTWIQQNGASIAANAALAPDGTMTAEALTAGTGNANTYIQQNVSGLVPLGNYTASVWLKADAPTSFSWEVDQNGGTVFNSVVSLTTSWRRYTIRTMSSSGGVIAPFAIGGGLSFPTTRTIYVWGAQLVMGSKAGAYNKTVATAFNGSYIPAGVRQSSQLGQNELQYSEQLDVSPWGMINGSISANTTTAPIGGSVTADALVEDTSTAAHRLLQSTPSSGFVVTQSAYIKAINRSWVAFYGKGGGLGVYFNVSTCAIGTVAGLILSESVQRVGNGWCRVSITYIDDGAGAAVYAATGDGASVVFAGNGLPAYYIWGVQVEKNNKVRAYNRTTGAALNP